MQNDYLDSQNNNGAEGGTRTHTEFELHWILSPIIFI